MNKSKMVRTITELLELEEDIYIENKSLFCLPSSNGYSYCGSPYQGINWIEKDGKPVAVIIKSTGAYMEDGVNTYAFMKSNSGIVDITEFCNRLLIEQCYSDYLLYYFKKEYNDKYHFLGKYFVVGVKPEYVVIDKAFSNPIDKALYILNSKDKNYNKAFSILDNNCNSENEESIKEIFEKYFIYSDTELIYKIACLYYKKLKMKEALIWFKRAAEKNHPKSQFNTGLLLYRGDGIDQDLAEAKEWFIKASQNGITKADRYIYQIG